jgi:hypothetical protein
VVIHRSLADALIGPWPGQHGCMPDSDPLRHLLERQQGLASRAQLKALGITPGTLRWRVGRSWRAVLPGVVATFTGGLDRRQWLIAAQLYAGPLAYLSSWTAAAWYGVEAAREMSTIRLTVPAYIAARRSGLVVVTRTTRVDESVTDRGPLRLGSRARAVVDAAREARGERRAQAIIIEAVQRRIVQVEDLRHELECGPRRGSAQVRRAVEAAEAGAWSVPEADLFGVLSESKILPPAWENPELRTVTGELLPTPDIWLDDAALAVQVHSRAYHLRDSDWEATVTGDSLLSEHGVAVLGVTPAGLAVDRGGTRRRVERAYLAARNRPRPAVIATPRPELRFA